MPQQKYQIQGTREPSYSCPLRTLSLDKIHVFFFLKAYVALSRTEANADSWENAEDVIVRFN